MSQMNQCRAIGCRALLLPFAVFCPRCWSLVPIDIRKLLEKHLRPRKRPSLVCQKWIDMAVAELLEFKTTGHYTPRSGTFMWDDEPPAPPEVEEKLPL